MTYWLLQMATHQLLTNALGFSPHAIIYLAEFGCANVPGTILLWK